MCATFMPLHLSKVSSSIWSNSLLRMRSIHADAGLEFIAARIVFCPRSSAPSPRSARRESRLQAHEPLESASADPSSGASDITSAREIGSPSFAARGADDAGEDTLRAEGPRVDRVDPGRSISSLDFKARAELADPVDLAQMSRDWWRSVDDSQLFLRGSIRRRTRPRAVEPTVADRARSAERASFRAQSAPPRIPRRGGVERVSATSTAMAPSAECAPGASLRAGPAPQTPPRAPPPPRRRRRRPRPRRSPRPPPPPGRARPTPRARAPSRRFLDDMGVGDLGLATSWRRRRRSPRRPLRRALSEPPRGNFGRERPDTAAFADAAAPPCAFVALPADAGSPWWSDELPSGYAHHG